MEFYEEPLLNRPVPFIHKKPNNPRIRNILLTGGSGFVGVYTLDAIFKRYDDCEVWCILRDSDPLRLFQNAKSHSLNLDAYASRIHIIEGNFEKQKLGISKSVWNELSEKIDCITHLACDTSYSRPYHEMREDWIVSLVFLLDFCAQYGISFHLMGGVGSLLFQTPEDMHEPFTWYSNGYFRLKWVSSRITDKYLKNGLVGCIYDPPYILGKVEHGGIHPGLHYTTWVHHAIFAASGCLFDFGTYDIFPVDSLASILVSNMFSPAPMQYIRTVHNQFVDFNFVRRKLSQIGFDLDIVNSREEFIQRGLAAGISSKLLNRYFPENNTERLNKIRQRSTGIFPANFNVNTDMHPMEIIFDASLHYVRPEFVKLVNKLQKFKTQNIKSPLRSSL